MIRRSSLRKIPVRVRSAVLAVLTALPSPLLAQLAPGTAAPEALIELASEREKSGDFASAAELFSRADVAASGGSVRGVEGLCKAELELGRFDEAIAAADRWVALLSTPAQQSEGKFYLGVALLRRGMTERYGEGTIGRDGYSMAPAEVAFEERLPGRESLREAAEAFASAAGSAVGERQRVSLLNLADALVQLDEYSEALTALERYDVARGDDPLAADLRCWAGYMLHRRVGRFVPGPDQVVEVAGFDDLLMEVLRRDVRMNISAALHGVGIDLRGPIKTEFHPPQYTSAALRAHVNGVVLVGTIIDEKGRVACARTLRGLPEGLGPVTEKAIKNWRFEPARLNGVPIAVFYPLTYQFTLGTPISSAPRTPPSTANDGAASLDAGSLIQRASDRKAEGDLATAAELFTQADLAARGGSVRAVAGLTMTELELGRDEQAIAAAGRWIQMVGSPSQRAEGQYYLGLALLRRGVNERYGERSSGRDGYGAMPAEVVMEGQLPGRDSLRDAAEALRSAAGPAAGGRLLLALLSLGDSLVQLGEYEDALKVLDEYRSDGGEERVAEDLRCWSASMLQRSRAGRFSPGPDGSVEFPGFEDLRRKVVRGEEQGGVVSALRSEGVEIQGPIQISGKMADYTAAAREAHVAGVVLVAAIVDEEGKVECARTLRGLRQGFGRSVEDAIKTWRFKPAHIGAEPLAMYYPVTYQFGSPAVRGTE
jgi:TonB family protein